MDSALLDALIQPTRTTLATEFWGKYENPSFNNFGINLVHFWEYYHSACRQALHDGGRHTAVRSHNDVVDVIRMLKSGVVRGEVRTVLRSKLSRKHDNEDEMLENAIDLAASLILMCDFGITSLSFSGRTELKWRHGTLQEFLADYFKDPPALSHEGMKLEKTFLARNLTRIGGIEIIWTENLVDHLRLSDDDTKVHIFHHASFLEYQMHSTESLLPDGLAAETLQTLALLCPSKDRETSRWLSRLPSLDKRLGHCGRLKTELRQIERFRFWRDRLIMLKQAYDETQPKTLTQWWHDRRNGVQWYTFWVAVLVLVPTILFGLIQSVEGALQVYASFKSLED
ncbi:hypothetical protein PG993_011040 [Apiospora rasikravindrae]|uniref:Uncharacterized protein n=1 Tax=Apiospora rasikravindrae TaxID=990691 RepID=A0ABR1SD36_9PEZI